MKFVSVLIADNQPLLAEGVKTVLHTPSGLLSCTVTAVARNAEQVEGFLKEYRADLLLVDPAIYATAVSDWVPDLKSRFRSLRILLLSSDNLSALAQSALRAGADGYILKSASRDELRQAVSEVVDGRIFLGRGVSQSDSSVAMNGATGVSSIEKSFAQKFGLTKREMEIVRYISQALTNKEISDRIYISDQTVSVHRKNIMRKLKVNSTASLIRMVFENQVFTATA